MTHSELIGSFIRQWRLAELVGAGAAAEVYRATHTEVLQECAVKVLRGELVADKERVRAFVREQEVLQSLEHPGIPAFKLAEEVRGRPCYLMGFCPGRSLRRLIDDKTGFDRAGCLLAAVAIMSHVHGHGVVHGDIKLENLILSPKGRLHLIDFGSAVRSQPASTAFFTRRIAKPVIHGTPTYLAPELLQGRKTSPGSDVYALGVLGFYLLADQPPFVGTNREDLVRQILQCQAPGIARLQPKLPRGVAAVLDRCLCRDPKERFQDAEEMLLSLKVAFKQPGIESPAHLSHILFAPSASQQKSSDSKDIAWIC